MPGLAEHTDADGQRAALYGGRLSVYGEPSMRRDDGQVSLGIDLPARWVDAILAAEGAASEGKDA